MAGTVSAHLRGTLVLTHSLAEGYFRITEILYSHWRAMSACSLQMAAIAHLVLLGLTEVWPMSWSGSENFPQILIVTGLMLVVSALGQRTQVQIKPAGIAQTDAPFDTLAALRMAAETSGAAINLAPSTELSKFMLSPREVALERQSQRLVEIADTAVRSRGEAEQRGQAWAELMSRVSHELRTPLNAVIGFSDVMSAELFGPVGHPRYQEYIEHIRDSGRALLKSAEDTLALTSLLAQPGSVANPEVLELDEFAAEAWEFVSLEGSGRHLKLQTSGLDGLEVLGERRPLRQILINLLSAAAARAPRGGMIELTARQDGDLVELEIAVPVLKTSGNPDDGALSLSLARALLELQESFLIEFPTGTESWRAITVLSVASQQDFFSLTASRSNMACPALT
jgi:signal transduction histidine kinase